MATPTRLAVLLQTRKSAAAGRTGSTAQAPAVAAKAQICWAVRRHVVLVVRRFMPGKFDCRNEAWPVNEDDGKITIRVAVSPALGHAEPREKPLESFSARNAAGSRPAFRGHAARQGPW